eukprot:1378313-Pleurochrysis_carterae.AAC.1
MQQERYLAQRDLCRQLRSDFFTPKATLTAGLENFMPIRSLDRINTALSKEQLDDGTWRRPVIINLPSATRASDRAMGSYNPIRMFNVFTTPRKTAAVLEELVTPFGELSIGGDDFNSA